MKSDSGSHGSLRGEDDLAAQFWAFCEHQLLVIQCCVDCGKWQFYPRFICVHCSSRNVVWREACGEATLESFSVVYRSGGDFASMVPYTVAIVRLAEGPTMMTNVVGCEEDQLHIGMGLRVQFERRGARVVPVFTPTSNQLKEV